MAAVFSPTMKRLGGCVTLLCALCMLSWCGRPRDIEVTPAPGYDYAKVVAGIVKLHAKADAEWFGGGVALYVRIEEKGAARSPDELDPNKCFGILKHVSMADGSSWITCTSTISVTAGR